MVPTAEPQNPGSHQDSAAFPGRPALRGYVEPRQAYTSMFTQWTDNPARYLLYLLVALSLDGIHGSGARPSEC